MTHKCFIPNAHPCNIVMKEDEFAWKEQYIIQCKCHMGDRWQTWQPTDPPFVCPGEADCDTKNNMSSEDD